jgi:lactam utilization protein B
MFNTPAEKLSGLQRRHGFSRVSKSGTRRRHYADVDTACIHGDARGAVDIARGLHEALKDRGIEVAPFKKAV